MNRQELIGRLAALPLLGVMVPKLVTPAAGDFQTLERTAYESGFQEVAADGTEGPVIWRSESELDAERATLATDLQTTKDSFGWCARLPSGWYARLASGETAFVRTWHRWHYRNGPTYTASFISHVHNP